MPRWWSAPGSATRRRCCRCWRAASSPWRRSEEHTSELQSRLHLVCRLLLDATTTAIYTLSLHDALPIFAYVDDDLPVGGGRSLMQPMVAARLLQAAAVQPKDAALVVGAGVGYEAAVLSLLARSVVALEEIGRAHV